MAWRRRSAIGALLAGLIALLALLWWRPAPLADADTWPGLTQPARPALYRADFASGGRLWLFGSVHVLPGGIDWLRGPVADAVADADGLVMEITDSGSSGAAADYARLAFTPAAMPVADRLDPALRAQWARVVADGDIDADALVHLDDWAAALAVARAGHGALGLSSANGVEARLRAVARATGKPVTPLETSAGQLALFDTLPPAEQSAMLAMAVARHGRARSDMARLLAAWTAGDVAALDKVAGEGLLTRPAIRAVLLDGRNAQWAARLAAEGAAGRQLFVAVGAAHISGVAALLGARGATVTRVQ